jgi:hypothetical protein
MSLLIKCDTTCSWLREAQDHAQGNARSTARASPAQQTAAHDIEDDRSARPTANEQPATDGATVQETVTNQSSAPLQQQVAIEAVDRFSEADQKPARPNIHFKDEVHAHAKDAHSQGSSGEQLAHAQPVCMPAPSADAASVPATSSHDKPQAREAGDIEAAVSSAPPAAPDTLSISQPVKRTGVQSVPAPAAPTAEDSSDSQKKRQPQQLQRTHGEAQAPARVHAVPPSGPLPPKEARDTPGLPGKEQRGNAARAPRHAAPSREHEGGPSRAVRRRLSAVGLLEPDDTVPRQFENDQDDIICVCNVPYKLLYRIGKGGSSRVRTATYLPC